MLKPGIILPPKSTKLLIGKLPDKKKLHWYVFDNHQKWDTSKHPHFSLYESDIIPLISDVLFVLDPEFCQFEYLNFAIRNSCHLFVETIDKLTTTQQEQLIELAHEAGTQIVVRADQLYVPLTQQLFRSNQFPRMVKGEYASTRSNEELFNHIRCFIRIILKLNPTEITEMAVAGGNFLSESTDFVDIHLDFADGMVASMNFSNLASAESSRLLVFRNGGLMDANFTANHLELIPENRTFSFSRADADELLIQQIDNFLVSIDNMDFTTHSLEEEKEVVFLINRIKEQLRLKSVSI